jgi:predicted nucleotidyltransferase component of viral defense system
MIVLKELSEKSKLWGVPVETVDKDWVIGHFLNESYSSMFFQDNLVFKGGTCLRKLYFNDYRFSEDLDFTASEEIVIEKLTQVMQSVINLIYNNVGIKFGEIIHKPQLFNDILMGYELNLPFIGAKHSREKKNLIGSKYLPTIKIDITTKEKIMLTPVQTIIYHPYTDNKEINSKVTAYCLEEIFSEKLRSLLQRSYTSSRDYYDLWYISKFHWQDIRFENVPLIFQEKCKIKNIQYHNMNQFFDDKKVSIVKNSWQETLGRHLRQLPDCNLVLLELKDKLQEIFQ